MLATLLLLQAATPDVALQVEAHVESVKIEQKGETRLSVRSDPAGTNEVQTIINPRPQGSSRLRNVEIDIRAEARIADPQQQGAKETSQPK